LGNGPCQLARGAGGAVVNHGKFDGHGVFFVYKNKIHTLCEYTAGKVAFPQALVYACGTRLYAIFDPSTA
jgi:hypothetical protein